MQTEVDDKALTQFDKRAMGVLNMAKSIVITDDEQYGEVGKFLTGLKTYQKELDATFDPAMKLQRLAMAELKNTKDRHAKPIDEAETITKGALAEYRQKRQAQIEAENRRALEDATRERMAQEAAERERLADEALAAREAVARARRAQEEADKARRELEAKMEMATSAKAKEAARKAQETLEVANKARLEREAKEALERTRLANDAAERARNAIIAPPPESKEMAKIAGVSYRKDYSAEVTDKAAFVTWAVSDPTRHHFLEPVSGELKKLAGATQGKVPVPGLKFIVKDIVSGRAG